MKSALWLFTFIACFPLLPPSLPHPSDLKCSRIRKQRICSRAWHSSSSAMCAKVLVLMWRCTLLGSHISLHLCLTILALLLSLNSYTHLSLPPVIYIYIYIHISMTAYLRTYIHMHTRIHAHAHSCTYGYTWIWIKWYLPFNVFFTRFRFLQREQPPVAIQSRRKGPRFLLSLLVQ